jgi:hypothetical protein
VTTTYELGASGRAIVRTTTDAHETVIESVDASSVVAWTGRETDAPILARDACWQEVESRIHTGTWE